METNRTIFESHGYLYKGAAETQKEEADHL